MIILAVFVFGLILGSFVNALVWRIYMQEGAATTAKRDAVLPPKENLSILSGRSMCPHCKHELGTKDLIPVLSWVWLGGKCRYCKKPISKQYPVVELATALLFMASYLLWPFPEGRSMNIREIVDLLTWFFIFIPGFMALLVYDLRWMILPNRIVYPLLMLASFVAAHRILSADKIAQELIATLTSVAIGGGLFYLLFFISNGRWIGGGDVKLGALIGLLLIRPEHAFLMLLLASVVGTLFVTPGLLLHKITPKSRVPFGPFLIIAALIVKLTGTALIRGYEKLFLG